jgi:SAM-dependent methyltransferase
VCLGRDRPGVVDDVVRDRGERPVSGESWTCPRSRSAHDWEGRYRRADTPWDLGAPPPALLALLEELAAHGERLRVLVPGAGSGHDAIAWAAAGHEVTALDVAPTAVELARGRAHGLRVLMDVVLADLFDLPRSFRDAFDVVWEQTCFCAVPLERRPAYVEAMCSALRRGGIFYGLFWHHGRPGGPPFDVTTAQVRELFVARFREMACEPVVVSAPSRADEFLATLRRR